MSWPDAGVLFGANGFIGRNTAFKGINRRFGEPTARFLAAIGEEPPTM